MHASCKRVTVERGVVLVVVLWILALLMVIAGSYSVTTRTETVLTARLVQAAQARALAEAGVWLAVRELLKPESAERWRTDGEVHTLKFPNGTVVLELQDEAGKIDLNSARVELLYNLLLSVGVEGNEALAVQQSVLDWRDVDSAKRKVGAEAEEYAAAHMDYGPRNGPFNAVDELRLVLGMDGALYLQIAPVLTVYSGQTGFDPDVAVRGALLALPGIAPRIVDEYLAYRAKRGHAAAQEPAVKFDPRFVSNVSGRVVTISSLGEVGDSRVRLQAVIRFDRTEESAFSVVSWREGGTDPAALAPAGAS